MSSLKRVLLFTYIPSPYQVELFNAIHQVGIVKLSVVYIAAHTTAPTARLWKTPDLKHEHLFCNTDTKNLAEVEKLVARVDLVIFSYYQCPAILKLIHQCKSRHQAWCFWGERPGHRQLGLLGTYYRKWKLSALHQSKVPIWGIGKWAVEQYRQEFGKKRFYYNLPYFSDLSRFAVHQAANRVEKSAQHFLFSGSLIYRKGVDLLATAFIRLAEEFPSVTLSFLGEGELRSVLENKLAQYASRIQFIGFQPWEALPKFYQSADVLCVPSRYDGWALVVPEGLAAGLPVISTNRTGAALELIEPNQNGWLIPTNSEPALYQSMKQAVLLSPAQYSAYSKAAQISVSSHSLTDGVEQFHQAIQKTLSYFP